MPVGMTVAVGYLIIILLKQPYFRKGDDRLHMLAQIELFLLQLAGYIFYNGIVLDKKSDVLMSVFLVIVVLGFIILFFFQTINIFRKLLLHCHQEKKAKKAPVDADMGVNPREFNDDDIYEEIKDEDSYAEENENEILEQAVEGRRVSVAITPKKMVVDGIELTTNPLLLSPVSRQKSKNTE